jgi:hypothetical protein
MNQAATPIMIHGQMARCGINFLMDILSKHSDTFRQPNDIYEFHHFMLLDSLDKYIINLKNTIHMKNINEQRLKRHLGEAWINYLLGYVDDTQKHIILKESNVDNLQHFFDYFPSSRLIIVVRDGRNAVASAIESGFVSGGFRKMKSRESWNRAISRYGAQAMLRKVGQRLRQSDFEIVCRKWNASSLAVAGLMRDFLPSRCDQVLLTRYEHLFQRTIDETKRILDFCGLSHQRYDWKALEKMPVRGSSFLRDADGNINFSKGIEPNEQFDPMKRWGSWSLNQQRMFRKLCYHGMQALGYPVN